MNYTLKAIILASSGMLVVPAAFGSGLFACSSSSSVGTDSGADTKPPPMEAGKDTAPPPDTSTDTTPPPDVMPDAPSFPAAPTLGTMQIDRMGRPAVNTALTDPLDLYVSSGLTENMAKDAYNADTNPTDWATNYVPHFEQSLGAFDGIDGVCGNQLGADLGAESASTYSLLAGALAGDMLWLNTGGTTSNQYLAVELNALGMTTFGTDTGGRGLAYDVVNITYSALVLGTVTGTVGGNPIDGTTAVPSKTNGFGGSSTATSLTFPYLGNPL